MIKSPITSCWIPFLLTFIFTLLQIDAYSQGREDDMVVAQDGSGDYRYIQDAIDATRAFVPRDLTITIKNGIYKEKLLIPGWITDITLRGESADSTIITYDDHAGKGKMGTFDSYTLKVEGNDIVVENITIANTAGEVGQAVALHIEGDRCVFRNCRFLGNQDTMFASGEGSRQYYQDCYIEGTTDFIFGPATAVFEDCHIHSKRNSYITAASTPEWVDYGYVFIDCRFTADEGVDEVYLGRPWRDYAKTVFIRADLGEQIVPEGWHNWSRPEAEKTTFYAEYGSTGPGAQPNSRVGWSHQLKEEDLDDYTLENIFGGWNPDETINAGN
ncbi:MAG: pectinesterase family protein [Cyclobacteriaceae bacterium]